jgi:hypothetical protein
MNFVAGRLFLLSLLAVDWAADSTLVAPAVQPLAAPMASTECYCHSLACRQIICTASTCTTQPAFVGGHTAAAALCPRRGARRPEAPLAAGPGHSLVYVFMSIVR